MAINSTSSTLNIAANKIVSIGKRSGNVLPLLTKEYTQFTNFLDIKTNELEAIQLPPTRKIQQLSNLNITDTLGNAGGLLNSLLNGRTNPEGSIFNKETKSGTSGEAKSKPKFLGGKLKLSGLRGIAVINTIFSGLDFASGLSKGESVGKAAAGAGGSLAGSLLGGAIGQALIPVPGLGFLIGSAAGSFLGGYAADRVVDKVEGDNIPRSNLRRELDYKIQKSSKEQVTENESQSFKAFRKSVDNFSVAVNKLGEFLGLSLGVTPEGTDVMYDMEAPPTTPPENPSPSSGDTEMVVEGGKLPSSYTTSEYGWRWGRIHHGVDYSTGGGTPVSVVKSGVVSLAGWVNGYGNTVIIDHGNGIESLYGHFDSIKVKQGQTITPGTVIGIEGNTGGSHGAHVHFELRKAGGGRDSAIPISRNEGDNYFRFGGKVVVTPRQSSQQPEQSPTSNSFVLEVHSVGVGEKQRSGLIPSYLDKETPASRALKSEFGSYPKDFRGGDLGGPRRGMNLIETDMKKGVESNAQRLFNIIRQNPNQHFHLFAGHNDVTMGETGTPGEQEYTRKVCEMIEQMARRQGIQNLTYHRSIISNTDLTQSNWERGRRLREASLKAKPSLTPTTASKKGPRFNKKLFEPAPSPIRPNISQYTSLNRNHNSITLIDRPVTTTIMVGGNQRSSKPVIIPVNSGNQSVVISSGPTPNQLLDGVAELVLLSTFG